MNVFDISTVLGEATPIVRALIVGALYVGDGREPQDGLIAKGLCQVMGFEPIDSECEKLNRLRGPTHRYFPYYIGDGGKARFYRNKSDATSSLYPTNNAVVEMFDQLPALMTTESVADVQTTRLDEISDLGDIDFVKINAQGAALQILEGGPATFSRATVVHCEVEFVPIYAGEPLFGDFDCAIRKSGFLFHRFWAVAGDSFRPLTTGHKDFRPLGQQLWAEVVYARDFTRLQEMPPAKLLKMAVIMHEVYRSVDLCGVILRVHDGLVGSHYSADYLSRVVGNS